MNIRGAGGGGGVGVGGKEENGADKCTTAHEWNGEKILTASNMQKYLDQNVTTRKKKVHSLSSNPTSNTEHVSLHRFAVCSII